MSDCTTPPLVKFDPRSASVTKRSLLELPTELRFMIYQLLLDQVVDFTWPSELPDATALPEILQFNQQIRNEAFPIYFRLSTWLASVEDLPYLVAFWNIIAPHKSSRRTQLITEMRTFTLEYFEDSTLLIPGFMMQNDIGRLKFDIVHGQLCGDESYEDLLKLARHAQALVHRHVQAGTEIDGPHHNKDGRDDENNSNLSLAAAIKRMNEESDGNLPAPGSLEFEVPKASPEDIEQSTIASIPCYVTWSLISDLPRKERQLKCKIELTPSKKYGFAWQARFEVHSALFECFENRKRRARFSDAPALEDCCEDCRRGYKLCNGSKDAEVALKVIAEPMPWATAEAERKRFDA